MADERQQNPEVESEASGTDRRDFLKGGIAIGAGILGTAAVACTPEKETPAAAKAPAESAAPIAAPAKKTEHARPEIHVPPGKLDEYYGFWSGGQSGEIRIVGVPSMRELKRIPVFNRDAASGWGADDFSKELLGGKLSGDTHHVHLSYTDGTYDGRYVYVNDKASARLARVRCDTMEVDKIADIPNSQGTHGIFPQRHKTGYVMCNAEFRTPQVNDGRDMDDPTKYGAMHTAIDGETMEVKWQVLVEGNMDLCATDYEGKYSFATCYNSEGGVTLEQMMASRARPPLRVQHRGNRSGGGGRQDHQGRRQRYSGRRRARRERPVRRTRIPIPKSPHGVNIDPTGKYADLLGQALAHLLASSRSTSSTRSSRARSSPATRWWPSRKWASGRSTPPSTAAATPTRRSSSTRSSRNGTSPRRSRPTTTRRSTRSPRRSTSTTRSVTSTRR